jgi:5-methyltetrahydropteroyltriglutamate--homocysteine methyltransferase
MPHDPILTTVVGSYPFPGWLEHAAATPEAFGPADTVELQDDATTAAVMDQMRAGLDVISDGEQSRFDFNLSFYAYLEGIETDYSSQRNFGPPAHDQRGKHSITGPLAAPRGLGVVEEYERLRRLAPTGPALKASIPGPYTLSGRITPGGDYPDRYAVTEALLPIVSDELVRLTEAGCEIMTVDEPSMSCYAYREDPERFVDIFNRTVEPIVGRCYLGAHLCFGNFKGRAVAPRSYAPMMPAFLDLAVDEIHIEMAGREFSEIEVIGEIAARHDVAVGVVDVKSYYIETPDDVADRIERCLEYVPADRLSVAPDCGLSQTARWAARRKLENMVAGAHRVRASLATGG